MSGANPLRGEAAVLVAGRALTLRPTFAALVRAEGELGPLLQLVERAAAGSITLGEIVALFWHCLVEPAGPAEPVARETLGEALVEAGLAALTPVLRILLGQILTGR